MSHHGQDCPQDPLVVRTRTNEALPFDALREPHDGCAHRGEVRLALAVLENAVTCLEGSADPWNFPAHLFRWEAEQWFESRDRVPLFSFERICSILNLDADYLRGEIHRWRAGQSRETFRRSLRSQHGPHRIEVPLRL